MKFMQTNGGIIFALIIIPLLGLTTKEPISVIFFGYLGMFLGLTITKQYWDNDKVKKE